MPRIAAINQDRGISPSRNKGAAVHLRAMREAFEGLGCQVTAFDQPEDISLEDALRADGGGMAFDMVYERYALGKETGARFCRDMGIPLVLEVNAPLADEQSRFRDNPETVADRARDRFLFNQANYVAAVSNAVAEYALQRGARPETVFVHPNGIDTGRFNAEVDPGTVRRSHVPDGACVIGFHGRLRPWHGFDHLVRVVAGLLGRGLDVHLLVVGEGDFSALGALPESGYTRVGWQDHEKMPEYVAAFDVLPLTYQPGVPCYFSPLKLMEAMACRVVPVVPDLGDLAQTVEHGETGFVYRAGDHDGLESLLDFLAGSPDTREAVGRRANRVAMDHSWSGIASTILERTIPNFGSATARRSAP